MNTRQKPYYYQYGIPLRVSSFLQSGAEGVWSWREWVWLLGVGWGQLRGKGGLGGNVHKAYVCFDKFLK